MDKWIASLSHRALAAVRRPHSFFYPFGYLLILVNLGVLWLVYSDWGDYLESQVAHSSAFNVRAYFEMYPQLDERIKIFTFDDPMAAHLGRTDYSMDEWLDIFAALDERKPKMIFVDKIFGFPFGDTKGFASKMTDLSTPVLVGGFYQDYTIFGRTPLNSGDDFGNLYPLPDAEQGKSYKSIPYGPNESIRDGFTQVGHIVYEGEGYIRPYVRIDEQHVLPHLSFYAGDGGRISHRSVEAGGTTATLDSRGRLLVNYSPLEYFREKNYGMKALYLRSQSGKSVDVVSEGDIVVLLPSFFTGNTDWVGAPTGQIPGGFLLISAIDNFLNGNFIRKIEPNFLLIYFFCGLGILMALFMTQKMFWTSLGCLLPLLVIVGLAMFVKFSVLLPWFPASLGVLSNALVMRAYRSLQERDEQVRLEQEVETAQLVQTYFFPSATIEGRYFSGEGRFLSASECSGDWWFHYNSPLGFDYVLVGDALGHGTSAALITAMASGAVVGAFDRHFSDPCAGALSPASIASEVNRSLYRSTGGRFTMTMFVGYYNPETKKFCYTNAGHNLPFIMVPSAGDGGGPSFKAKPLVTTGNNMGMDPEAVYNVKEFSVVPGQRIFAYSDGLVESSHPTKKNLSTGRIKKMLTSNSGLKIPDFHSELIRISRAHHEKYFNEDDVTVLTIEFTDAVSLDPKSESHHASA